MSALSINNITVKANGHTLLKNISLNIQPGEIHAIVGPNGAGKTTLLKAVSGEISPSNGKLQLCALDNKHHDLERARRLAVLPQFSALNFPFSTQEVVALGRMPHSSGYQIDKQITQAAMQTMDIGHLAQRLYTQLSGGEKQRCQLARVLAQIWREQDGQPRLLLLDEPTSGLDLGHQQQFMATVKQFAAQGTGVLMVVHDINLAAQYADFCLALCAGQCVAQGKTAEVFSLPLLNQLFNAKLKLISHPDTQQPYVIS